LSTSGVISGTPTKDGSFTIVVAVLDGSGIQKTATLSLTVVAVAKSVVAGYQHTCALMNNGHVKCWGANNWGQLGNGKTDASYTPVEVTGLSTAEGITAEGSNTCARLANGSAVCWGQVSPISSSNYGSVPVQISNLTNVIDMSTGCAVKSDGSVSCWGTRATVSGSNQVFDSPTPISGFAGAVTKLSGSYSACAILGANGALQCWGGNYYGILGNDTTDNSVSPVYVQGLGVAALQISVGTRHVCAVLNGGSLACWGDNYFDELGVSSSVVAKSLTPRGVQGLTGVVSAVAGTSVTCSVHTTGAVKCWGDNTCEGSSGTPCGMLGDLTVKKSTTPMTVWAGTPPAKEVALGSEHGCLLAQGGSVYCWGLNSASQLGRALSDTGYSQTPLKVTGI
jgi:alpha-tubulin suppressor-like RCC1 family protein